MTVIMLMCFAATVQPVLCGEYADRARCERAGPYIAAMTALEFGVPVMRWRCEARS